MLELRSIVRRYAARLAVDDVSFAVAAGEIVGLLGPNGAGKSTLLRISAGLQPPDSGSVWIAGVDLWAEPIAAKERLGHAAEEPAFYDELSAEEYLAFVAAVRRLEPDAARARAAALAASLGLGDRMGEPVGRFSHGMRKKVAFMAAVLHRPAALLCDEALEGFDATASLAARRELRALAEAGTAIVFSSHVTETIERLCDRVVILHGGRVARITERSEWGAPPTDLSALEREYLQVVGTARPADAGDPAANVTPP